MAETGKTPSKSKSTGAMTAEKSASSADMGGTPAADLAGTADDSLDEGGHTAEAKAKFAKALEEAKAGVAALGHEAQERAKSYRDQAGAKGKDWQDDVKSYGDQARTKAVDLARDGKSRAADAMVSLGTAVADTAPVIDEKLGPKYGDYARSAARQIQEAAESLEAKSVEELGEDAREFVRKSPALAVGLAAATGFFLSRLFSSNKS